MFLIVCFLPRPSPVYLDYSFALSLLLLFADVFILIVSTTLSEIKLACGSPLRRHDSSSVIESPDIPGSSGFFEPIMDPVEQLLHLRQEDLSIEECVHLFCEFLYHVPFYDENLFKYLFRFGHNELTKSLLPRGDFNSNLRDIVDYALLSCGSPFTVGEAESLPKMAASSNSLAKMAATPQPSTSMVASPESRPVMSAWNKCSLSTRWMPAKSLSTK